MNIYCIAPKFESVHELYTLDLDLKSNKFSMEAAPPFYIHADKAHKPSGMRFTGKGVTIYFETTQEAIEFTTWLKKAEEDARYSFNHMLD